MKSSRVDAMSRGNGGGKQKRTIDDFIVDVFWLVLTLGYGSVGV